MAQSSFSTEPDRRRLRARRRRRRVVLTAIKAVFWTLVLAGVFIMGIGYGRTLSGDSDAVGEQVTVTREAQTIEATVPTQTVTVTSTVTVPAPKRSTPAAKRG